MWSDTTFTDGATVRRIETNEDRTGTWASQFNWDRRPATPGWRIGATASMHHKSRPRIPNYSIRNIPRDPGTT